MLCRFEMYGCNLQVLLYKPFSYYINDKVQPLNAWAIIKWLNLGQRAKSSIFKPSTGDTLFTRWFKLGYGVSFDCWDYANDVVS